MNYALIVYDSCRFDAFLEARTPTVDGLAEVRLAYAQATFTLAAHHAMFAGFLPHCREALPYYNRFVKQLWRQGSFAEPTVKERAAEQVLVGENIVVGFRREGYYTIGTAAPAWFSLACWSDWFEDFQHSPHPGFPEQLEFLQRHRSRWRSRPLFLFANFSETHEPYTFEGCKHTREDLPAGRTRHRLGSGPLRPEEFRGLYDLQVAAIEYLDSRLPEVLELLPAGTRVVLTSDHGECFGDDGIYGHTQYHPKVMEVPLAIFEV